jgi:hypothetical protein
LYCEGFWYRPGDIRVRPSEFFIKDSEIHGNTHGTLHNTKTFDTTNFLQNITSEPDEPGENQVEQSIQTRLKFDLYSSTRLIRNVVKYGLKKSSQKNIAKAGRLTKAFSQGVVVSK